MKKLTSVNDECIHFHRLIQEKNRKQGEFFSKIQKYLNRQLTEL